ncbi:zinc-binding dehydrogenase [Amycolatopsis jiangsuensis]|uniref:NADPH:quinone reductase-like Zn-dependent oxidoreductase n=1 Tax=Amycolatopsis jiangsuensis TaxID=1181879 RepID=A0A840J613_9PSEU|nr:zinc-binding dehydrogenase [Amycolatopsis jiangsuensis]MBB4689045.1 NADPH:quinone reductase-like Zn-dependent oxidoreductase [Amycolatopsis jiangsuensis]
MARTLPTGRRGRLHSGKTTGPQGLSERGPLLVAAEAIGVGGVDAVIRSGALASYGFTEGFVPGSEVAGRLTPGESVLVRGASGSLGIMTVQLAARGGAGAVAVTTSSAERGARLRELRASRVLGRDGERGTGYDVIIDVVAGPGLPVFFDRLNPNGRLVVVGAVAGRPPADFGTKLMAAFQRSLSFATFSAATVPGTEQRVVRAGQFEAAARGALQAVVHEVLPLHEAVAAHRKMADGEVFGRIVLTPR